MWSSARRQAAQGWVFLLRAGTQPSAAWFCCVRARSVPVAGGALSEPPSLGAWPWCRPVSLPPPPPPRPAAFLVPCQPHASLCSGERSGRWLKALASSGFLMLCFLGFPNRSRASGEERRKPVCSLSRGTWTPKGEGNPAVCALGKRLAGEVLPAWGCRDGGEPGPRAGMVSRAPCDPALLEEESRGCVEGDRSDRPVSQALFASFDAQRPPPLPRKLCSNPVVPGAVSSPAAAGSVVGVFVRSLAARP